MRHLVVNLYIKVNPLFNHFLFRLQGIGPEETLYAEGNLRHDHVDLCILVSGKMTVWCDGLPIHGIYPGQFINSVEWASVLQLQARLFTYTGC